MVTDLLTGMSISCFDNFQRLQLHFWTLESLVSDYDLKTSDARVAKQQDHVNLSVTNWDLIITTLRSDLIQTS